MQPVKPWKIYVRHLDSQVCKKIAEYTSRFEAERHFLFLKKYLPNSINLLSLIWEEQEKSGQPTRSTK